jgi:hypothetical protein
MARPTIQHAPEASGARPIRSTQVTVALNGVAISEIRVSIDPLIST